MNKKGFAVYYVIFFIIIIMMFAFVYLSQVRHSTKNLVRDFDKMTAKELCDFGFSAAKNIIYKNYAGGNFNFHSGIQLPIVFETNTGKSVISKISILNELTVNNRKIEYEFNNVNFYDLGTRKGLYDVFKVEVEGITLTSEKMKATSFIKVIRMENP